MSELQHITPDDKWRMYGFTPYNMSPIQKAIQFGHAVVEYMLKYGEKHDQKMTDDRKNCKEWAENNKTFIILNGGTTNKTEGRLGTMNQHLATFKYEFLDWPVATFNEIDLGDQLTSFVFLVPEQVYNTKRFPDFVDVVKLFPECDGFNQETLCNYADALKNEEHELYQAWVINTGGPQIVKMREFLKPFKLAN